MAIPRGDGEERVTNLELFFDLVFVFAITQVTALMSKDPTWAGVGHGMLMLAALWFAWASYAWLTNTINPEEGGVRLAFFATMAALLVASLAVPHAFDDNGVIFGGAYLLVRAMHIGLYAIASRGDTSLVVVTRNLAGPMLTGATLILIAGFADGALRSALWCAALAIEVAGPYVRGVEGWRLHPAHFAERHGLIIIIALGESIVAVGVGVSVDALSGPVIVAAVLGVAVAAALWWAYFDVVALVAERRLTARTGGDRARMARDSWTFLHLPMVAGIVLVALGMKKTLGHVDHHLKIEAATAMFGGMALYLVAHVAFRYRNLHTVNKQRLVTALLLVALLPFVTEIAALIAVAVMAALLVALIAYEAIRFADARDRIRHQLAQMPVTSD
jgi:low temperature requirement protein LtrA